MRKLLVIATILASIVFSGEAKANYGYASTKCTMYSEIAFEAYKLIADNSEKIESFGADGAKYDEYFDKCLVILSHSKIVENNSEIFPQIILETLLRKGISHWEQHGKYYLDNGVTIKFKIYTSCMLANYWKENV